MTDPDINSGQADGAKHSEQRDGLSGAPIRGKGLAELDEALDRLARRPATARLSRPGLSAGREEKSSCACRLFVGQWLSAWDSSRECLSKMSPNRCK